MLSSHHSKFDIFSFKNNYKQILFKCYQSPIENSITCSLSIKFSKKQY